ncbi:hypothetical protein MKS83_04970 [Chryseobacterium sp. Y16C]|uniref:hypothetical protein n=1 Tax=Chryseobacterium sp. Y16C TaxID=2920939 RepID=UPI001F0A050D|nr:hypothetical protein [Chryseobacterium sp. Y16C]UMQ43043.1 hypothetical protein MKS83_04970 [Chryseobacterium sp. Y16C]
MGARKKNGTSTRGMSSTVKQMDLDHFIVLDELPVEQYSKMLKEAGLDVDEDEAAKIMTFLNQLARMTIKEIFSPD